MLNDGSIAEMKTGEGKTLVSTLAAYLNALTGEGVHGMYYRDAYCFHAKESLKVLVVVKSVDFFGWFMEY